MAKLNRVCVLLVAVFIIVDVGLCPALCLNAENRTGVHDSLNQPAQGAAAEDCGVCSSGLLALPTEMRWSAPVASLASEPRVIPLPLAPAVEIDHPPRWL